MQRKITFEWCFHEPCLYHTAHLFIIITCASLVPFRIGAAIFVLHWCVKLRYCCTLNAPITCYHMHMYHYPQTRAWCYPTRNFISEKWHEKNNYSFMQSHLDIHISTSECYKVVFFLKNGFLGQDEWWIKISSVYQIKNFLQD